MHKPTHAARCRRHAFPPSVRRKKAKEAEGEVKGDGRRTTDYVVAFECGPTSLTHSLLVAATLSFFSSHERSLFKKQLRHDDNKSVQSVSMLDGSDNICIGKMTLCTVGASPHSEYPIERRIATDFSRARKHFAPLARLSLSSSSSPKVTEDLFLSMQKICIKFHPSASTR